MDEMLADLISEGTLEGLEAAARARPDRRPQTQTHRMASRHRTADARGEGNGGKRRYTVAEIAETFHVSRKTPPLPA